jgi:hypothetical protein
MQPSTMLKKALERKYPTKKHILQQEFIDRLDKLIHNKLKAAKHRQLTEMLW